MLVGKKDGRIKLKWTVNRVQSIFEPKREEVRGDQGKSA
jgi:hypothetical protein